MSNAVNLWFRVGDVFTYQMLALIAILQGIVFEAYSNQRQAASDFKSISKTEQYADDGFN